RRRERRLHALPKVAGGHGLHGDVRVVVRDPQIVDADDVPVFQARDDLVFLQETIEADDALGNVGYLAEYFEHHECAGALALRQVDLAHAAAADLFDASMSADDHGAESI